MEYEVKDKGIFNTAREMDEDSKGYQVKCDVDIAINHHLVDYAARFLLLQAASLEEKY